MQPFQDTNRKSIKTFQKVVKSRKECVSFFSYYEKSISKIEEKRFGVNRI